MMKKALSHGLVLVLIVGVVAVVSMVMMSNNNSTSYEVTGDSDYGTGYAVKQTSQPVQLNDVKYGDVVAIKTVHKKYWVSEAGIHWRDSPAWFYNFFHGDLDKKVGFSYRVTRADRDNAGAWERFKVLAFNPQNPDIPNTKMLGSQVKWGDTILLESLRVETDPNFKQDPKYINATMGQAAWFSSGKMQYYDLDHNPFPDGFEIGIPPGPGQEPYRSDEIYLFAEDGIPENDYVNHVFDWRIMQARYTKPRIGTWRNFKVVYPLDPDGKKGTKGALHFGQPFALKTVHGRFVTGIPPNPPEHYGHLEAKATNLGPWEQFTMKKMG